MIAMAITGVLRDPSSSEVVPAGRALYQALSGSHGLAMLADTDPDTDGRWLRAHGFDEHNFLVDVHGGRHDQLVRVRNRGSVAFVVESDPTQAADTVRAGHTVLFFASPSYTVPDHQPGTRLAPTPWGELLDEVSRQEEIKARDNRSSQELL